MNLVEVMKEMAVEEGNFELPDWFDDFASYLFTKDQIIFFVDKENDSLEGYVCYWKYGKRRFKFIKNCFQEAKGNPIHLTRGDYVYIPLGVARRDKTEGFQDRAVHSIVRKNPSVKEVSLHNDKGEFIRIKVGGEQKWESVDY